MPFLTIVVIQVLIFGTLAVLLRYVLVHNINSASSHIHELTQECEKKLEEAKKKKDEADRHYDEAVNRARDDAEKAKARLLKEGHDEKAKILQQANQQSGEITKRAQSAAEAFMEEIEKKIGDESVKRACELLKSLLPGKVNEETHIRWTQELLRDDLEGLSRLNLPEEVKEAEISSAFPMGEKQTKAIEERLKEKLKRSIRLREKVDPSLILGYRLSLGNVVIDGTLKSKLESMARHG